MKKIVKKRKLGDTSYIKDDIAFWLSKSSQERVATVDYLRRQYHGSTTRLQRSVRIIEQTQSATGRKQDAADLEALGEE